MSVRMCVSPYQCVLDVYFHMSVRMCVSPYKYAYVCISVRVCVCVYLCMSVYMCLSPYEFMCVSPS